MIQRIPDPNVVFPNSYGTTCFLKNVITAPNILVGDYTYYDDPVDPTGFEKNNVLFNWKVLFYSKWNAVPYEHGQPPDQQRHNVSLPCFWWSLGGAYAAPPGATAL